ncbi:DNA-binding protein [Carbonactinospora thermoautotrophica]|uniref:Transcriptional regulator n=1 Tax=Carbonactinospora thermoautotrophica TaxID=1469144 RepID=A0A132NKF2_9ACTN|nr:Rv2175c family DNA-binding protein [Carbonactinospora thermoautotrophica]KWX00575.1 transcriptional regulator [Carbonactinospora thermoautotrophica]KWX10640.1 transcriptional regulator [Carbonactinospora thermoautotrophica]MCX9190801.1 DNA-binding protein [Carbonactinospora thermoautotrophica]
MSEIDAQTDELVSKATSWLPLPEAAQRLGVDVNRMRQLLRDRQLVAVRRDETDTLYVPEVFIQGGKVLKGLPGTLTLLADAGYSPVESLRWLFTEDDSLRGTPVSALVENRGTEVKRRAQTMGF